MPKPSAAKPRPLKPVSRAAASRRRDTGGQARSEQTRAELIAAALEVFGEMGYASASTRAIAGRAKLTLPVLAYHFGGKEGLYLACAEHLVAQVSSHMLSAMEAVHAKLARPGLTHSELLELLAVFLNAFIDLLAGSSEPKSWMGFLMREQANPTAAFDILYAGIMSKALDSCSALVGRLLGFPVDHEEVRLRALTCLGQAYIFRAARAAALRTLGWKAFRGEQLEAVRRVVLTQTRTLFAHPPAAKRKRASC